jgi:hypothetical protein
MKNAKGGVCTDCTDAASAVVWRSNAYVSPEPKFKTIKIIGKERTMKHIHAGNVLHRIGRMWGVGVLATMTLVHVSCITDSDDDDNGTTATSGDTYVLVSTVSADYSSGDLACIDMTDTSVVKNMFAGQVSTDNSVVAALSSAFVLERSAKDNIMRIDHPVGADNVAYQQTLPTGANIHDLAVLNDDKAYAALYGKSCVGVIDPADGSLIDSIDMSAYTYDSAGVDVPYIEGVEIHNGICYVLLARLSVSQGEWGVTPTPGSLPGLVVAVSTSSHEITDTMSLLYKNPQDMRLHASCLYIACTGHYGVMDGGVEKIDLNDHTQSGSIISESDLGGDVSFVEPVSSAVAYADAYDMSTYSAAAKKIDMSAGTVAATLDSVGNVIDAAYDGTVVYIADRGSPDVGDGIVVVDPADNSVQTGRIDVGLPPNSIAVLPLQ